MTIDWTSHGYRLMRARVVLAHRTSSDVHHVVIGERLYGERYRIDGQYRPRIRVAPQP